jgi:hypothetical protein
MKIFISHQKADSEVAKAVEARLRINHRIDSYVDVIDTNLARSGESLGEYLRREMGNCTQLIAVVSGNTKNSWRVPWEIGIATEKDFPLATFFGDNTPPPEYLQKWPYLRSLSDVDQYAKASTAADDSFRVRKSTLTEDSARRVSTGDFFRTLRASLGQP